MHVVIGKNDCNFCNKVIQALDIHYNDSKEPYIYINLDRRYEESEQEGTIWKNFVKRELEFKTVPVVLKLVGGYDDLIESLKG